MNVIVGGAAFNEQLKELDIHVDANKPPLDVSPNTLSISYLALLFTY
jgi:hypothetical protein